MSQAAGEWKLNSWQESWLTHKGHKAAWGEDPTKTDSLGHQWVEDFVDMGFCGWGMDNSHQTCAVCKRTRKVLLHPGPNPDVIRRPINGRAGFYGQWAWEDQCDEPCKSSP